MPLDTFFYDEEYLLNSYLQAYYEHMNYQSWLQGSYYYIAQTLVLANAFSSKHQERLNYPNYQSYFEKRDLPKQNLKDQEQDARDWLCACY